ncbi:MAG TPA: twin-arginine translocase TatA/TatE family subunit, partial [Firmicutes bacterium]|nr:twin-arginine translocase TatA/TatE family subunit [Bacillota bacterium]
MLGRIGPLEAAVILAVVLLIFGPSKLPGLAKAIG